jgi:hypothetical protein
VLPQKIIEWREADADIQHQAQPLAFDVAAQLARPVDLPVNFERDPIEYSLLAKLHHLLGTWKGGVRAGSQRSATCRFAVERLAGLAGLDLGEQDRLFPCSLKLGIDLAGLRAVRLAPRPRCVPLSPHGRASAKRVSLVTA